MGDVLVTCESCGHQIKVSEFVDPDSLSCAQCGGRLSLPETTRPDDTPTLTVRQKVAPQPAAEEVDEEELKKKKKRRRRHRTRTTGKVGGPPKRKSLVFRISHFEVSEYSLAWVTGLILVPTMIYLRWGEVFKEQSLEDCKLYGMWGLGLVFAVVVLEAFKEEMFDGILCLFFPPYALYYLFFKSDSFFVRAVMIAFMAGFGLDMYLLFVEYFEIALNWSQTTLKGEGYE